MASKSNKSNRPRENLHLDEKLQDIKRLQSNWMKERKEHQEKGVKETKTEDRERPKKRHEVKKKEPDTISWIVNSGPNTKKKTSTSLRSRSASPSTRASKQSSKPTDIRTRDCRPSEGNKSRTGAHSRPSSGSRQPSSRPTSGSKQSKNSTSSRPPSGKSTIISNQSNFENKDDEESIRNQSELNFHELETENKDNFNCVEGSEVLISDQVLHSNGSNDRTSLGSQSVIEQSQSVLQSIGLLDEDVLNRLADQVANRLRSELKRERERVGDKLLLEAPKQGILYHQDALLSHQCTKCKQIMVAPDHTPTLLVPCGHTFCEACSEDRIKCPSCRTKITSTTVNTALQQIINQDTPAQRHCRTTESSQQIRTNSYNPSRYTNQRRMSPEFTNHRLLDRGEDVSHRIVQPQVTEASNQDQGKFYQDQFDGLEIRCEALRNEEVEIQHGLDEIHTDYEKEKKVLGNIEKEEQRMKEEIRKLEDKLQLLNNHKEEYERRCNDLEKQQAQESGRLNIVSETLRNHMQNMEKVKMLARNFNISIE